MAWQEQLEKAIAAIKNAAESETAKNLAGKARQTATQLAQKAREGRNGPRNLDSRLSVFRPSDYAASGSMISPEYT